MRKPKAYGREEKLQIIMGAFIAAYQRGLKDMTVSEIARAIHNEPSTKLRALLNSLIAQNALVVSEEPHSGIAGFRRIYALSPDYLDYAKAPPSRQTKVDRVIRINTRKGQFVEVLK